MKYELKCSSKKVSSGLLQRIKGILNQKISNREVNVMITDNSREASQHDEEPFARITVLIIKESTSSRSGVILSYIDDLESTIIQALAKV